MTALRLTPPAKRVVTASAFTNVSDGIRMAALPLLAAATTQSAFLVATVFVAGQLPWLLLGIWAGGLVDRSDRRQIAVRTAGIRTALLLLLAALILVDAASIWLVIAAAFVLGVGEVLADTANGTLIPLLVHADDLERANSRLVTAEIMGNELLGPALGGALFAVGAALPFFSNAGLLAAALLVLAGLAPLPALPPDSSPTQHQRARDGLVAIRRSPFLRTLTWSSSILAAVDAAWFALLVLLVERELGLGPAGFGLLLTAGAIGGIVGAWLADKTVTRSLAGVLASVFAAVAVSLMALSITPSITTTVFALVVTSGAFACWNVRSRSARQRATPPDLFGRVGAGYRTVVVAAAIGGAVVGGAIATVTSIGFVLLIAALLMGATSYPLAVSLRKNQPQRAI